MVNTIVLLLRIVFLALLNMSKTKGQNLDQKLDNQTPFHTKHLLSNLQIYLHTNHIHRITLDTNKVYQATDKYDIHFQHKTYLQ